MAEEWHNTLSDLSNTNQHLEARLINTMHNWFKDLELNMQQKVEGYKNPDPGAARAQEQLANLTSKFTAIETSQQEIKTFQQKFAEKSAQSVTHIELEARLTKLQDGWNNNLKERFNEYLDYNEETFKRIEKETDRLLDDLENRLGAKITNMEQMMKKQTTDLETRLGSKITSQKIFINTLSEGYQQFTDIKEDLLTKSNLQPEIQNIQPRRK